MIGIVLRILAGVRQRIDLRMQAVFEVAQVVEQRSRDHAAVIEDDADEAVMLIGCMRMMVRYSIR